MNHNKVKEQTTNTKSSRVGYPLRLVDQTRRWPKLVAEYSSLKPEYIAAKMMDNMEFSLRHGTHSLAVPTKLRGVRQRQSAIATLHQHEAPFFPLFIDHYGERLVVVHGYQALGEIAQMHVGWVHQLLPWGLKVYLIGITGMSRSEGYWGCNILLGNVGNSLDRIHASGDGPDMALPDPSGD